MNKPQLPIIRVGLILGLFCLFASQGLGQVGLPQLSDRPIAVKQFHPLTLDFEGPKTSEDATPNPFTDYRLFVQFHHVESGKDVLVRGFYAADGDAANSHATEGDIWRVKFAPDMTGEWTWQASLRQGEQIAIHPDTEAGVPIKLANPSGQVVVNSNMPLPSVATAVSRDFRKRGRIIVQNQRFKFTGGQWWLKAGADSPENFLAYEDFDGTYRIAASDDDGESKTDKQIHRYTKHLGDWKTEDVTWVGDDGKPKGKAIVGAINYLASKGMNSVYFLTMNIKGDGKDVWPYLTPDDFSRFDCSKLGQWELVFDHMQKQGIALHVQLQETENETLLDGGETGAQRKLYFYELVSRFGHHPALIWNLGEENGPAEWTPIGQTPEQRIAMAKYLKQIDPYNHPVVMHTHADVHSKNQLLTPLLGEESIDGLSFQVAERKTIHDEIVTWLKRSQQVGHPWLIAMDEVGMWHTGCKTDVEDPNHDTIRRYALWGSLMAGAAGVEWYFGANSKHNDLTSEDWRQRDRLWDLTRIATSFFEDHLPWYEMESAVELVNNANPNEAGSCEPYCLAKHGRVYAIYLNRVHAPTLDLSKTDGEFRVRWYDPLKGGELAKGSVLTVQAPDEVELGVPPGNQVKQDWVVLVTRMSEK